MNHPYKALPAKSFWKTAVADRETGAITDLWVPKFDIGKESLIVTFGSCFAQHFSKALQASGYNWLNSERPPPSFSEEDLKRFNYSVFSARTGNIYTTSLLRQWLSWAAGDSLPPEETWTCGERFYDPFRPMIEPEGFESAEEMARVRQVTIGALQSSIAQADVFVFTLGLTESWFNGAPETGYEYPLCPGTVRGDYAASKHRFVRQDYDFVKKNLIEAIEIMRGINPNIRVLLTVSPVPLAATNSGEHVLVATSASKAILRAVAQAVCEADEGVDYFPSYEIIANPVFKGAFFGEAMREVLPAGVDFVMKSFFEALEDGSELEVKDAGTLVVEREAIAEAGPQPDDDVICEEELLAAFAPLGDDS